MADALPPLNTRVLERYIDARIEKILGRLVSGYRDQSLTDDLLYGAVGAISELGWLLDDARRIQQQQGQDEIRLVTGNDYGRRPPHG